MGAGTDADTDTLPVASLGFAAWASMAAAAAAASGGKCRAAITFATAAESWLAAEIAAEVAAEVAAAGGADEAGGADGRGAAYESTHACTQSS